MKITRVATAPRARRSREEVRVPAVDMFDLPVQLRPAERPR